MSDATQIITCTGACGGEADCTGCAPGNDLALLALLAGGTAVWALLVAVLVFGWQP